MEITVNKEQYQTLKAMGAACLKDPSRLILKHIHYNPKAKHVDACDGHILRREPMDLGEREFLLDPGNLFLPQAKVTEENKIPAVDAESEEGKEVGTYPDVDRVIPEEPGKETGNIALDLALVSRLFKTFPKHMKCRNGSVYVQFLFSSDIGTVSIYRKEFEDSEKLLFCGAIMPARHVCENDGEEIKRITAWKKAEGKEPA